MNLERTRSFYFITLVSAIFLFSSTLAFSDFGRYACGRGRCRTIANGRASRPLGSAPQWLSTLSSSNLPSSPPQNGITRVIVTGAAGRTGRHVFSLLQENPFFHPVGLVRTERSAKKLLKSTGASLEQIVVEDVTLLAEGEDVSLSALANAEAMVICTSAVPIIVKRSVVKFLILKLLRRKAKAPEFRWKPGQCPEKVDYAGQLAQVNLAKKIGAEQVVLISSMGGTQPDNFLNSIGKKPDGTGHGDILIWKRKAEKYLMDSNLSCTIIHPGGLKNESSGKKQIILDVDDNLMRNKARSISRPDVAKLCVAALSTCRGKKVAFDCVSRDLTEGEKLNNPSEIILKFLEEGKKYDFSK